MEVYADLQAYTSVSLADFWQLSPLDVYNICNGISERDTNKQKVELANIRNMIFHLWRLQIKDSVTDPREMYTLWWEDQFDDKQLEDLLNTDWEMMEYLYNRKN
jgi:hypothetical protein